MKDKDPQRFWGFVVVVFLIVGSITAGLIFGGSKEEPKKEEELALEVPVDTMAISKMSSNNGNYDDNYFDVENEGTKDQALLLDEERPKENVNNEPIYKSKPKSYYQYQPSSSSKKQTQTYQESEPVQKNESSKTDSKKKRVRAPSDSFSVNSQSSSSASSVCKVVIDNRNRTVKTGSTVYMHASSDFTLGGITIKKNTMLQGTANFQGERLRVTISQVKVDGESHFVKWKVFDSGVEGIYCPEKLSDDIVKEGANEAIGTQVNANVPVVGSVKMNLKRKNQENSVVLPDGYKLTVHE